MPVTVMRAPFVDVPGMAFANQDERRIITEDPVKKGALRITRIEVTADADQQVALGQHYHETPDGTFEERFDVRVPEECVVMLLSAPADDPGDITQHDLTEGGWSVVIPERVVHTFLAPRGVVLVSRTYSQHFVSPANQHEHPDEEINTFPVKLV